MYLMTVATSLVSGLCDPGQVVNINWSKPQLHITENENK